MDYSEHRSFYLVGLSLPRRAKLVLVEKCFAAVNLQLMFSNLNLTIDIMNFTNELFNFDAIVYFQRKLQNVLTTEFTPVLPLLSG